VGLTCADVVCRNCFVPHLLLYTLAKMRIATERLVLSQQSNSDNQDSISGSGSGSGSMDTKDERCTNTKGSDEDDGLEASGRSVIQQQTRALLSRNWGLLLSELGMPVENSCNYNEMKDASDDTTSRKFEDNAFAACTRMLDRMYGDAGVSAMSAEEGELMRNFFISACSG
jgi:hypothetical protein